MKELKIPCGLLHFELEFRILLLGKIAWGKLEALFFEFIYGIKFASRVAPQNRFFKVKRVLYKMYIFSLTLY